MCRKYAVTTAPGVSATIQANCRTTDAEITSITLTVITSGDYVCTYWPGQTSASKRHCFLVYVCMVDNSERVIQRPEGFSFALGFVFRDSIKYECVGHRHVPLS